MRTRHLNALTVAAAVLLGAVPLFAQDNQTQDKPAQQKQAVPAPSKPRPVEPAGFHLVLLVGDEKQAASPGSVTPPWAEQLTPSVVKALKDVQQFLPFKSYQVFDSTFIRGERGSTSVKAPGNQIYLANVNSWQMNNEGRYYVRVTVTPNEAAPGLVAKEGSKAAVLDTTFDMAVGETIVAGTSRQPVSGTALVMVVTALPPSALKQ